MWWTLLGPSHLLFTAVYCCLESNKTFTLKVKKYEIDIISLAQRKGNAKRIMMATQLSILVNIVTFGVLCYVFEMNNGIGPIYYMLVKARHSNQLTCLSVRQCTW